MKIVCWWPELKTMEFIITDHYGTICVTYPYPLPIETGPPSAHPLVLVEQEAAP